MTVIEIARHCCITPNAVRYYVRKVLLHPEAAGRAAESAAGREYAVLFDRISTRGALNMPQALDLCPARIFYA